MTAPTTSTAAITTTRTPDVTGSGKIIHWSTQQGRDELRHMVNTA